MLKFRHLPLSRALSHKSEYLWVVLFAAATVIVTTIPYWIGYGTQGESWQFTGFVISVDDGNAFIGKMLSGTMGEWLFRTPYTAFPQRGFLIFLPYLLLGKLAAPAGGHEKLVILYHLFRFLAVVLDILATYAFLSFFVAEARYRRFGLILVTLGGGLGWLELAAGANDWFGSLPLEFYSPESFGFLSLYVYPHYALARALLLWGLLAYLKTTRRLDETPSVAKAGLKVGALWLLAALAQPLTGMVVGAVVGIYLSSLAAWQVWLTLRNKKTAWPRLYRMARMTLWAGIVPAPFVLYNLISTRTDPFVRMWTEQSYFGSPHPFHYLLAYGLILPLSFLGARCLWRSEDWTAKLPLAWVLFLPVLAYAPIGVQRRLPEGMWVVLVLLAMKALESTRRRYIQWSGALLLFALPSTLLLLMQGALAALHPAEPVFRPTDEVMTFQCLAQKTRRDAVVLSSYETGNALPAWAPAFVVVGLGPESVGFSELMPRVKAFYQEETLESDRLELLGELSVDYVYWGPHERKLGRWDPGTSDYLSLVCQSGDYAIFAVDKGISGLWGIGT